MAIFNSYVKLPEGIDVYWFGVLKLANPHRDFRDELPGIVHDTDHHRLPHILATQLYPGK